MNEWQVAVLGRLKSADAMRVVTSSTIANLCALDRPGIAPPAVMEFIAKAEAANVLRRIIQDVYLNLTAKPRVVPAEAASFIEHGAVVSLHSVLGDAGVLNNPTDIVFCVVPTFRLGAQVPAENIDSPVGTFRFHQIPAAVLMAGQDADRLVSNIRYPRATSEAALCHWIYLAASEHSRLTEPSPEADVTELDRDRLFRLARAVGIADAVSHWIERADRYAEEVPDHSSALGI